MAKAIATDNPGRSAGKHRVVDDSVGAPSDENWGDGDDYDEHWLNSAGREKDSSRVRRQMRARRELERRREEKYLRQLVADWLFED